MGFLVVANICVVTFLIGLLFSGTLWDSKILFPSAPVTEATVGVIENYYLTWWNGAMAVKGFIHVVVLALFASLIVKVAGKSETAYTFGGGSLVLLIFTVGLYMSVTLPAMRTIAKDPLFPPAVPYETNDLFSRLQAYWAIGNKGPLGDAARANAEHFKNLQPMSFKERVEGLSVLCAANTLAILLLVGVLALQIGDWYIEETILKEAEEEAEATVASPVTVEKKTQ